MSRFHDEMTLADAREILRTLAEDGHACPLCTQNVKVYRRKVSSNMAAMLIRMWREGGREYVYLPDLRRGNDGMDQTVMQFFGLIEEEKTRREDGGRAGWWRVTDLGDAFLHARGVIRKYAHVYNGRCLRLSGDSVTIRTALGTKFNYEELMAGV